MSNKAIKPNQTWDSQQISKCGEVAQRAPELSELYLSGILQPHEEGNPFPRLQSVIVSVHSQHIALGESENVD